MSVELIIVEFYFSELLNLKQADLIGKLLFSVKLCGTEEGSNKVAGKVTRSVTSCVFSCMQLLKAIDLTAGALNDTAVSQYAFIERYLQPMPRRNRSIIQFRKKICDIWKIANSFTSHVLKTQHNNPNLELLNNFGDLIQFDYARLLRYLVKVFGLKDKAMSNVIDITQ